MDLDSLLEDLEGSISKSQNTSITSVKEGRMSTAALSNNINELDTLLQDLSAARYSGCMDGKEAAIITETRTISSTSRYFNGYSEPPYGYESPPKPPERTKSSGLQPPVSKFSLNGEHHELHAVERTRNEETKTMVGAPGSGLPDYSGAGLESKWEYMGYGIWEPKEGEEEEQPFYNQYHQAPPAYRTSDLHPNSLNAAKSSKITNSYQASGTNSRHGASTATAELDDLMTSLNDFKLDAERNVDEPVIGGAPNLDMMLGDLQEDMDKQGIKTKQKGVCAACTKPIVGQVITALGHTWHPEHFTCNNCNQELGTVNFFERDGAPYCEQCYHNIFSPRCAACQGPILDKCVSALDKTWHPECFRCASCGNQFGDEGFHEKDNAAYCRACYFDQFAPKCAGCGLPITENYISSLNRQWHPSCFVCKECGCPFTDGNFFEHEGFPYCETHYHALRGSLCAMCQKAISGRCITAMFRKFHPECFVCSFCLKQLNKGTFKEQGDKPYCHECFDRLFG